MDRACENCRFCIYAHSMRGKEEPYCERYSKWIGNTLLCSEWEMVSVPKQQTNADRIRAMSDEELAEFIGRDPMHDICPNDCQNDLNRPCKVCALDWLKQEVPTNG